MNYCRKCQSDYEKPGTCNCFAPQTQQPVPVFVPYIPYVAPQPWLMGSITITGTPCPICGKYNCTETHITYGPTVTGALGDSFNQDLGQPLSYEQAVKWGRSMMGGDTSHMVE